MSSVYKIYHKTVRNTKQNHRLIKIIEKPGT